MQLVDEAEAVGVTSGRVGGNEALVEELDACRVNVESPSQLVKLG
jgi:hypothetical protein